MSYIIRGQVIEGTSQTFLDQVRTALDIFATADDVTAISVTTFDLSSGERTATTSISPADAILDEPSTGYGWSADDKGFNARIVVPGTHYPAGGTTYRTEIRYEYVSGDPTRRLYELQSIEVYGLDADSSSSSEEPSGGGGGGIFGKVFG